MYIPVEERIKEITQGICPYVHKICDGLCNNCEILSTPDNTFTKSIIPSKQGRICTYEDLNTHEDMAMGIEEA